MTRKIVAKIKAAAEQSFLIALRDAQAIEDGVFKTDAKGNRIRVFTAENPCGKARIREAVIGNRGVCKWEMFEQIGDEKFHYLVKLGYLVKDKANAYYHVTAEMAASYNLPKVNGLDYTPCAKLK
jgi:hypothetical protein